MRFQLLLALGLVVFACNDQKLSVDTANQVAQEDAAGSSLNTNTQDMMIRIAELEILPEYVAEYTAILEEEAAASVAKEPGVICIFPMYEREDTTSIRLIEIYADEAAYEQHLKTPHFLHYKTATLKMVKSLRLVEMESIDPESMGALFRKLSENR